jgi:hypothetical protein
MAATETFVADLKPLLRSRGYKGAGSTFRKLAGDSLFVVNFQRSRDGVHFYINLGGQPMLIDDVGCFEKDRRTLLESECVFRTRVGERWPRALGAQELMTVRTQLDERLATFERQVSSLGDAIRSQDPEELLRSLPFGGGTPEGALHLARLCKVLGERDTCREYVRLGRSLAGPNNLVLLAKLRALESGAD